jgi:uridylate kinase
MILRGEAQVKYQRVLLKLSGEALMGGGREPWSGDFMDYLAAEIRSVHDAGIQLGVVVGGGNIFRGSAGAIRGVDRVTGDYMGMLATLINCLALADRLERHGCSCQILSPFPLPQSTRPASADNARQAMENGRVVLFAGGTGNPFFTTDSAAVLRALESGCQAVLKGTKVDGVYDRDPGKDPAARFLPRLSYREALEQRLGVMDLAAFSLCLEHDLPIVVFDITRPGNVLQAALGAAVGSLVDRDGGR